MNVDNILKAAEYISKGTSLLSAGPLSFYLTELVAAHDLLMERFAPFHVGDRVRLKKAPDFDSAPGWLHYSHFLVPGTMATVGTAECGSRGFRFGVAFDDESWVDERGLKGVVGAFIPIENKHEFSFGEDWLEPVEQALPALSGAETAYVLGAINALKAPDRFLPRCAHCAQPAGSHALWCRKSPT